MLCRATCRPGESSKVEMREGGSRRARPYEHERDGVDEPGSSASAGDDGWMI